MHRPYENLRDLLREKSVKFGHFQLASGKESDFFIDCKLSILGAQGHVWAGLLMLENIGLFAPDALYAAGVELGGCPLASAVSTLSVINWKHRIDGLYVRKVAKDHGTKKLVEGLPGTAVDIPTVLLEDVVTTGGSSLRAVETLRANGCMVLGVIALVDRLEGAREAFEKAEVPFSSIYTREDMR